MTWCHRMPSGLMISAAAGACCLVLTQRSPFLALRAVAQDHLPHLLCTALNTLINMHRVCPSPGDSRPMELPAQALCKQGTNQSSSIRSPLQCPLSWPGCPGSSHLLYKVVSKATHSCIWVWCCDSHRYCCHMQYITLSHAIHHNDKNNRT